MNWSIRMLPGILIIAAGAAAAFGSERLARRPGDAPRIKLAGSLAVAVGAALVFLLS